MKAGITAAFLSVLLASCSGDDPDSKSPEPEATQVAPSSTKTNPAQDMHISGVQNTRVSGAPSTNEHISGQ